MIVRPATHITRSFESRRTLYLRSRRLLVGLLARRSPERRRALESAARRFLRGRPRGYLARVVGDRGFALAAAAAIMSCMAGTIASALPPVELSDVAAGTGGFVINGIDAGDNSGLSVSGAGDVNGDGLADVIVGAPGADPGGNSYAGESYVIFSPATPPCPWDCADGDGNVGIVDFMAVLADWGNPSPCDFDDGGVGITDFLALLANWGPCP